MQSKKLGIIVVCTAVLFYALGFFTGQSYQSGEDIGRLCQLDKFIVEGGKYILSPEGDN